MAKKVILATIFILILAVVIGGLTVNSSHVNVYIDGENVSVQTTTLKNTGNLNNEICDYTLNVMNNPDGNITTLKEGIHDICINHGLDNADINIDSSIGSDCIPMIFNVEGTSMLPTLQDGQKVLLNKTKDIHIGDIVVADSPTYGNIVKRVDQIEGNEIYLISDNKNVETYQKGNIIYEKKGITTWVDYSDIIGVVIEY